MSGLRTVTASESDSHCDMYTGRFQLSSMLLPVQINVL